MANIDDFNHIKDVLDALDLNRPSRFAYTQSVLDVTGTAEIDALEGVYVIDDSSQINSIPAADDAGMESLVINIGLRTQAATLSRMMINHFFGRVSLNLIKLTEKVKLLAENHLVNRYIAASGKLMEYISISYAATKVTIVQNFSSLSASAPDSSSTPLDLTAAVYDGNAGVMTGADKKKLDDLDTAAVKTTGDQTVAGVKTFSSIPVLPASDPSTDNQAARKAYVDTGDAAAVKLTGDQTVAGTKTFDAIPVLPALNPTLDNQAARKAYIDGAFIHQPIAIAEATDLDNITTPGMYFCISDAVAATLLNCPSVKAFSLLVEKHNWRNQILIEYSLTTFTIYVRNSSISGEVVTWGSWYEVVNTSKPLVLPESMILGDPTIKIDPYYGLRVSMWPTRKSFTDILASQTGYALSDGATKTTTWTLTVYKLCYLGVYFQVNVGGSDGTDNALTRQTIAGNGSALARSYSAFTKLLVPFLSDISIAAGLPANTLSVARNEGTGIYAKNKVVYIILTPGTYTYTIYYDNDGAPSGHGYRLTLLEAACEETDTVSDIITIA